MALGSSQAVLAVGLALSLLSAAVSEQLQCPQLLDDYLVRHSKEASPYVQGQNQMVYFLHVPRTAGRTFHACLLKLGTPPSKRCPKAYDHLRINMTLPNCNLLSSHDDFSVVSMLPDNVAVLTHLRDPIDRFMSAYEFAIEVGCRSAFRPASFKKRPNKIATEDVWPWSYLVPFFAKDVHDRVTALLKQPEPEQGHWIHITHPDGSQYYFNKVLNSSRWNLTEEERQRLLPPLDPYNNPLVMPLHEFIRHPIAKELLHNGQMMQVLGVSNYSHWGSAGDTRRCLWADTRLQRKLMEVAKARIDRFLHVGVTDRLFDSVAAAVVGMHFTMAGPAYGGTDEDIIPGLSPRPSARNFTAADLPDLSEVVRQARVDLQSAQRQLFRASQLHQADSEVLRLKAQVAQRRMTLREAQEDLLAARATLRTSVSPAAEAPPANTAADPANPERRLGTPLGEEFQRCANRAQARNLERRDSSLLTLNMPDGRYITYSKAARKAIDPAVMHELRQLNLLDTELHQHATLILNRNRELWASEGRLEALPTLPPVRLTPKAAPKFKYPKPKDDASAVGGEPAG
ncbi:hypothetical protein V8C86DRAFT_1223852 [Haematococcus lacustris]